MRTFNKIVLWGMPVVYLFAAALFLFKGLSFLSGRQNLIMGILLIVYGLFRFFRSYKISREEAGIILITLMLSSCNHDETKKPLDTPTTGSITMAVDESFMPVIEAQLDVFHSVYQYAKITPIALPENDAFNLLFNDSTRLILASRMLTDKEIAFFNSKKIFPKQVKIAVDAIAVIVNRENPDSVFTVSDLSSILKGEITNWNQLSSNNRSGQIELMFDNVNSGLVRHMVDSVAGTADLKGAITASKLNTDVISYVASHKNSIGLIGVSWISDRDDSTHMSFSSMIRTARLGLQRSETFKPYQAYIATEQYPLTRDIYLISTDPHKGLAEGFIAFAASDKGQRIILKSGILPATAPIRLIQVSDE